MPQRRCKHKAVEHVRKFVAYAKATLNEARYYPPFGGYRFMVALMLYSKCITVAEATVALLDAGFSDEAFGMTRTLIDIFITLRYIANQDTDSRAKLYWQFLAKDSALWSDAIKTYWPHQLHTLDPNMARMAANYKHPHRWSGKTTAAMALELDTVEVDPATGNPMIRDFAYGVMYRWTSHFVHPSIVALHGHVVKAGHDPFTVHSRTGGSDMGDLAAYHVGFYVSHVMLNFYRCMGDPQPHRLGNWASALVAHLTYRH